MFGKLSPSTFVAYFGGLDIVMFSTTGISLYILQFNLHKSYKNEPLALSRPSTFQLVLHPMCLVNHLCNYHNYHQLS